jgi:hypothetical protein
MEAKLIEIPPQTVDDYADYLKLREAFAPTERQYQKLYKQLKELCEGTDPNKEFVVQGERHALWISACRFENEVDVARAKRKLGVEKFLECCTVTLKALGNYLSKPDVDALTISVQGSSRSFSVVPVTGSGTAHKARE